LNNVELVSDAKINSFSQSDWEQFLVDDQVILVGSKKMVFNRPLLPLCSLNV
jgi:hypothetical protein